MCFRNVSIEINFMQKNFLNNWMLSKVFFYKHKIEKLFSMIYISTFPLTIYYFFFFCKLLKFMHLNYVPFCSHKNWFSIQFYFFLWKIFSLYFKFTSRIFNFPLTSLTSSVSRNRFIKEFCFFISCKRIVFYCVKK